MAVLTELTGPNSLASIRKQLMAGQVKGKWVVLVVFSRFIFSALVQILTAGFFYLQGHPAPWQAAVPWWILTGGLVDVGCIGLLVWLTCKEGIRLFDLGNYQHGRIRRDLLLAVGVLLVTGIPVAIASSLFGAWIYGDVEVAAVMTPLPLWAGLYCLIIWTLVWSVTEDLVYYGYAFPRLEVLFGNSWGATLVVAFAAGVQHMVLPVIDWRWAWYRFAVTFVLFIILGLIYPRLRRLLPFNIVHWVGNFISVLTFVVLPTIGIN